MLNIREFITVIFLAGGLFLSLTAVIGIFRLPDFYSRFHASGNCETLALLLFVVGFSVYDGFTMLSVKLFILFFIVCACNPVGSHALARAAYRNGFPMYVVKGKGARDADPDL